MKRVKWTSDRLITATMQEHVQNLFQRLQDAHTRYQKPYCLNTALVMPFAFDLAIPTNNATQEPASLANEPVATLTSNVYTSRYLEQFPDAPVDALLGQQVLLLDGVEVGA